LAVEGAALMACDLTDRAAFMIISGGVNIYPQECENLLIAHSKVAHAAVFGVPMRK
jgi:long-chain acyl-CoA synthetase